MQSTNYLATEDLSQAAAFLAIGIPQQSPALKIEKPSGKVQFVFFFEECSADGQYSTRDALKAWADDDFIAENPDHPLAYIKAAFEQRVGLLSEVKGHRGIIQSSQGGTNAFISHGMDKDKAANLFK